jgi:uncharacterized membrane protein YdjX (TVP38/TMEM64 family)
MKLSGKQIIFIIFLVAVIAFVYFSGMRSWLTIEALKNHKQALMFTVQRHYFFSVAVFILCYALMIITLIPFTPLLTLASGAIFGTVLGALYTVCGALAGCLISLVLFRYVFRDLLVQRHSAQFDRFQLEFRHHGINYLLSLVLLPIMPFSLITILAGISDIALWKFILAIGIGMLPTTFLYTYTGQQLSHVESANDILSWHFILLFTILALLSLFPIVMSKIRDRLKR